MSVRSHLLAAALPLATFLGGAYAWQGFHGGKLVEVSQLDIYLSKTQLRTCGVEKLRSFEKSPQIQDDRLGGLLLEFPGDPKVALQVWAVAETRTRIESSWRKQDDSPSTRKTHEELAAAVAGRLVQCAAS